jgi:hypothetical protein
MRYSKHKFTADETGTAPMASESCRTIAVIDEVLGDSIHLRDLYRDARRQNGDIEFYRLRQLFNNHYREQLCLVDLLVDGCAYLEEPAVCSPTSFFERFIFRGSYTVKERHTACCRKVSRRMNRCSPRRVPLDRLRISTKYTRWLRYSCVIQWCFAVHSGEFSTDIPQAWLLRINYLR